MEIGITFASMPHVIYGIYWHAFILCDFDNGLPLCTEGETLYDYCAAVDDIFVGRRSWPL